MGLVGLSLVLLAGVSDMTKKTFGESLYGKGENPSGQISQTSDSTIRNQDGLGPQEWKWGMEADGPSWNSGFSNGNPSVKQRKKK